MSALVVSGLASPMVHHRPTPVTAPKTTVIRMEKARQPMQISEHFEALIATGATDEVGEQDAGADSELGDDHVRYAHQGDEHGRRQIGDVPDGKFHNATDSK